MTGVMDNVYIDQAVFDKLGYLLCTYKNDPVRKKLGEHLQTFINEYRSYMDKYMASVCCPEDWSVALNIYYRSLKFHCVRVTLKFRDLKVEWIHVITEEMALKDSAWIVRRLENLTDEMERKIKTEYKPLPNDSAVPVSVSVTENGHIYVDAIEGLGDPDDVNEPKNIIISKCTNVMLHDLCGSCYTACRRMLLDNLTTFIRECDEFMGPFLAVKVNPEKWQVELHAIADSPYDPHKIYVLVQIRYDNLDVTRLYVITETYCSDHHMKTIAFLQGLTEEMGRKISLCGKKLSIHQGGFDIHLSKETIKRALDAYIPTVTPVKEDMELFSDDPFKEFKKEINDYMKNDEKVTGEQKMSKYRQYVLNDLIKKAYFNKPYTVVIWINGDKTIVKCQKGEKYDPEKGLAMCFAKFFMGNDSFYYRVFEKYLPEKKAAPKKTASKKEAADKE